MHLDLLAAKFRVVSANEMPNGGNVYKILMPSEINVSLNGHLITLDLLEPLVHTAVTKSSYLQTSQLQQQNCHNSIGNNRPVITKSDNYLL